MTYEEMASDAGYRGEEAAQVAAALEARDRAWADEVWAAEQEAFVQAEIEEESMSEKLSERMREYLFRLSEREPVTMPEAGWPDEVAALEAKLDAQIGLPEAFSAVVADLKIAKAKLEAAQRSISTAHRIAAEAHYAGDIYAYDLMKTVLWDGYGEEWELKLAAQ